MPRVVVPLRGGESGGGLRAVADVRHRAVGAGIEVPDTDRYLVVSTRRGPAEVIAPDPARGSSDRLPRSSGPPSAAVAPERKQAFSRPGAEDLERAGGTVSSDGIAAVVENGDGSVGHGEARSGTRVLR